MSEPLFRKPKLEPKLAPFSWPRLNLQPPSTPVSAQEFDAHTHPMHQTLLRQRMGIYEDCLSGAKSGELYGVRFADMSREDLLAACGFLLKHGGFGWQRPF